MTDAIKQLGADLAEIEKGNLRANSMIYVITKPCPVCKQQLTKQRPTDTVHCPCGKHVWQG